jgi:hypothetical protein
LSIWLSLVGRLEEAKGVEEVLEGSGLGLAYL